jgi:hypothetical protein
VQAGGKQNNPPAGNSGLYGKQKVSGGVKFSSHWLVRRTIRQRHKIIHKTTKELMELYLNSRCVFTASYLIKQRDNFTVAFILWHIWSKQELWSRKSRPLLGNGSANTPVARQRLVAARDRDDYDITQH